jgi:hypothetical protein
MDREKSSQHIKSKFSRLINIKIATKFFCLFILTYILLIAAWPVVDSAYLEFYRSAGELIFGHLGNGRVVRFSQPDNNKFDICITAFNRYNVNENGEIEATRFHHNVLYGEYIQIAFLTALIVATPLPLKRKGWALIWALILIHIFIAFKLTVIILSLFNIASGKNCKLADRNIVLMEHLTIEFIIAFFIWVFVSFRGQNHLKAFTQTFSGRSN